MPMSWEKQIKDLEKQQSRLKELAKEQSGVASSILQSFTQSAEQQAQGSQQNLDNARQQVETERDIINAKLHAGQIDEAQAQKDDNAQRQKLASLAQQEAKLQAILNLNKASEGVAGSIANALQMQSNHTVDIAKNFAMSYVELVKTNKMANVLTLGMHGLVKTAWALGTALARAFNPMSVVSSLIEKIKVASVEFMFRTSTALAGFSKAVGDAGEMKKAVAGAMELGAGVNIEQAATAAAGLATSLKSLTTASPAAQTAMINIAAKLEVLGVSASQSGKSVEMMSRSMGMSGEKAMDTMLGMAAAANAFGQTSAQYLQNWSSMMPSLAAHGKAAKKVFEGLAAQAKSAGLEMDVLFKVASKYDTFDSAAQSVGNLNAILGGDYLNSLEMVNMNEKERIDALKRAFEMNGKTFAQMERFERKAIAEQLGVAEGELAQMMGISTRESRKSEREARKRERNEKLKQKLLRTTVDLMTRISNLFQMLFAKGSVMNALNKSFERLAAILVDSPVGDMIKEISDAIGVGMAWAITTATDALIGLLKMFVPVWTEIKKGYDEYLKPFLIDVWDSVEKKLTEVRKEFKKWWNGKDGGKEILIDNMKAVQDMWKQMKENNSLANAWTNIKKGVKNLWKVIEPIWEKIKALFWSGAASADESFLMITNKITEYTTKLKVKLQPWIDMFSDIADGLRDGSTKPIDLWNGFVQTLVDIWDKVVVVGKAKARHFILQITEAIKMMWVETDITGWLWDKGIGILKKLAWEAAKFMASPVLYIGAKIYDAASGPSHEDVVAEQRKASQQRIAASAAIAKREQKELLKSLDTTSIIKRFEENSGVDVAMKNGMTLMKNVGENAGGLTSALNEQSSVWDKNAGMVGKFNEEMSWAIRTVDNLSAAMNEMPAGKSMEIEQIMTATSGVTAESAKATAKVFKAAERTMKKAGEIAKQAGATELTAAISDLAASAGGGAAGGGAGGGNVQVTVMIGNKEFDGHIEKVINNKLKSANA